MQNFWVTLHHTTPHGSATSSPHYLPVLSFLPDLTPPKPSKNAYISTKTCRVSRSGFIVGKFLISNISYAFSLPPCPVTTRAPKTSVRQVMEEIRKALGRNIIVADGLSVGVAWTSVRVSHEPPVPPAPPPPEEESSLSPSPPAGTAHGRDGRRGEGTGGSPGGGYTDAATEVAGHAKRRRPRTSGEMTTKRGGGGGKKGD